MQLRFRLQGVDDIGCETCVLVAITTISRCDYVEAVRRELDDGISDTSKGIDGRDNGRCEWLSRVMVSNYW